MKWLVTYCNSRSLSAKYVYAHACGIIKEKDPL